MIPAVVDWFGQVGTSATSKAVLKDLFPHLESYLPPFNIYMPSDPSISPLLLGLFYDTRIDRRSYITYNLVHRRHASGEYKNLLYWDGAYEAGMDHEQVTTLQSSCCWLHFVELVL